MRCSTISRAARLVLRASFARAGARFAQRHSTAFALALLLAMPAAEASELQLQAPRAFGYVVGDTLTLEADIRLDPGARLDPASLPQPRKVSSWLDLVSVEITPPIGAVPAGAYRLRMTYQSFFSALEPRSLEIPPWPLTIRDGEARRTLSVPAFRFVVSPLRELVPSHGGNPMALQPDILPAPAPLGPDMKKAGLSAAVAALAALGLALAQGWRPFATGRRPLAAAARQIRRRRAEETPQAYRDALVTLHRAFDASAGRRLLKEDLGAFLEEAPALAPEREDIERLFGASRTAFFGAGIPAARSELPYADLVALSGRLARAERQMPRAAPQGTVEEAP